MHWKRISLKHSGSLEVAGFDDGHASGIDVRPENRIDLIQRDRLDPVFQVPVHVNGRSSCSCCAMKVSSEPSVERPITRASRYAFFASANSEAEKPF
jgi:hypothetical protein